MIAVIRFNHNRQADILGFFPGFFSAAHDAAFRNRYTTGFEQGFGQIFVAGDAFCDRAGAVGFCRPDTALCRAMA